MADNFTVEPVAGTPVKTFASDDVGGVDWPFAKMAWGPRDTANEVDDASGKRLPVKISQGLGGSSVVSGQISVGISAAALSSVAARRFKITAHQDNVDVIYLGPATVTTSNGYPLWPGQTLELEISNLNIMQGISGTAAQKLAYLGEV